MHGLVSCKNEVTKEGVPIISCPIGELLERKEAIIESLQNQLKQMDEIQALLLEERAQRIKTIEELRHRPEQQRDVSANLLS
jgi:hypothetical protein